MISKEMLYRMNIKKLLELLNKFNGANRSIRFSKQAVCRNKKNG